MGDVLTFLTSWDLTPLPWLGLGGSALLYLTGSARVTRQVPAHPWPARNTACFLAGTLVALVALSGPPAAYDDVFFWAHMAQHILLTLVAAPLFVLGDPVLLLMRASDRNVRSRVLVPVSRSAAARWLSRPIVGWLLFSGVMVITHVPAVYDFALENPAVHDYLEHPLYLITALVFFYPLLAPTGGPHRVPEGMRIVSLLSVMVPMAFVGFFVYAAPHLNYSFYAHVPRPFGPAPLPDQRLAGALMWSLSMGLSVIWLCVAGLEWLRSEERRGRRLNVAIASGRTTRHR